jgi:hypothetical protein
VRTSGDLSPRPDELERTLSQAQVFELLNGHESRWLNLDNPTMRPKVHAGSKEFATHRIKKREIFTRS